MGVFGEKILKGLKGAEESMPTRPEDLRKLVHDAYSAAAKDPGGKHAFPVGMEFARSVGYPEEDLKSYAQAADSFAGVSNVSVLAEIEEGSTVLDLGCGSGLDALIASRKTGPKGKVVAVDFSEDMIRKAMAAAIDNNGTNIEFHKVDAETLPLDDDSVDVAIANGIFNLNPMREKIFSELHRVLKPGGKVFAAELILIEPQPEGKVCDIKNWFS